jgi:class 3 adenylate cyclase
MPSTVFFTGHMVDRPDRAIPRFEPSRAPEIARRIGGELEIAGATDGFASGACGGDIVFLEAILARGGRAHVTLPCAVDAFRKDCVDIIPGADWVARFDRLLESASTVEILGEQYASDNAMASECCSRVMVGLAERCARDKGEDPLVIALWDGRPGDAVGGTHSCVQFCIQNGYQVRLMTDLEQGVVAETRELSPAKAGTSSAIKHATLMTEAPQQICAVVFADAVGFSRLREREVPAFARQYLGCAMQTLQAHEIVPLVKNTWGDGLYLVFESVREAGLFALDFRDRILATDWLKLGFTCALSVRIGLHAGPLYRIYDPLIGQWSYTGSHVTRTARLEPSADPGKVFATLAFVALAAAERVTEFTSRAAGRRRLVKDAGELSVYEIDTARGDVRAGRR